MNTKLAKLWRCAKCQRRFANKNQTHFCSDVRLESHFEGKPPETRDLYKAFRVVKSLRAGIIWVNHMQPTYVEAPWGGYKQSGFGRELGPWGLEEYLETKQVFVNLDETPIGWY